MRKTQLVIYGLGGGFEGVLTLFTGDRAEIVGCIDRNAEQSKYADRYPILKPEDLNHKAFDYVLICSRDYQREIADVLREKNVPAEKIAVAPNCLRIDTEYQNTEALEQIFGGPSCLRDDGAPPAVSKL